MNKLNNTLPVIVAVTEHQPDLLRFAAGMAQMLNAPLRVVYAQAYRITSMGLLRGAPASEQMRSAGERVLEEARSHVGAGPDRGVEYVIHSEPPAYAIQTESKNAALVVLGADDVNAIQRLSGENVAERAALHSSSPVLVVPPRTSSARLSEIVVGIDIENPVVAAIGFALGMADLTGAKVRVVNVVPDRMGVGERTWHERRLVSRVRPWLAAFPGVDVHTELLVGSVDRELAHAARRAELVVVGRPNQPHLGPLFSKPVARAILQSAPFAVAVVPEGCGFPPS